MRSKNLNNLYHWKHRGFGGRAPKIDSAHRAKRVWIACVQSKVSKIVGSLFGALRHINRSAKGGRGHGGRAPHGGGGGEPAKRQSQPSFAGVGSAFLRAVEDRGGCGRQAPPHKIAGCFDSPKVALPL